MSEVKIITGGMIRVHMSYDDITRAFDVANARTSSDRSHGLKKRYQGGRRQIEMDAIGACGELAFAIATGRKWNTELDNWAAQKKDGDVDYFEVRTTTKPELGLQLYDWDAKKGRRNRPFVLVQADVPTFTVVGWCIWRHGAQRRFWQEYLPTHSYLVPREILREPVDLILPQGQPDPFLALARSVGLASPLLFPKPYEGAVYT